MTFNGKRYALEVILCFQFCTALTIQHSKDEFKFHCGVDICTTPWQFCNQEEERCNYCSKDVCQNVIVPVQCHDACKELASNDLESTTTSFGGLATSDAKSSECQQTKAEEISGYVRDIILLYIAIIITVQALYKQLCKNLFTIHAASMRSKQGFLSSKKLQHRIETASMLSTSDDDSMMQTEKETVLEKN